MPNRIIRDWTQSEKVDQLSCEAERFFTRLIMRVDDYGCFSADTRILRGELFILKLNSIREADISRWMAECQKAGLIAFYSELGKNYLVIKEFNQRKRQMIRKHPPPVDGQLTDNRPLEKKGNTEEEKEGESPPNDFLGVVCYDAEKEILKNPIEFERILVAAKKTDFAAAKISLRKYHLYLEEKEQYPKGRKSVFAGFEKWLMNEHKFNSNETHKRTSKSKGNSEGARQVIDSLKDLPNITGEHDYSR